ncbi:MAG: DNA repair exonuclease [Clostridia bacterium]|nr:DNA repair exonuclease [Clostridia bacterium]
MELKIIHTADIHFDTAFSGLAETHKAAVRRQDLHKTFSKIIALSQNADMLFIAGDLFDGKMVSRTTLDFLKREFEKIPHVRVFISAGNHDCFDEESVYHTFDFGENVHVFKTTHERVETEHADIYGVSFEKASDTRVLMPGFSVVNPDKINLLVIHGNLAGEGYNPIKLSDLEDSGMDYVALGHIHAASGMERRGNCYFAYSGCPEGRGFDETGEKGVLALSVKKGSVQADFVPTCQRQYIREEIDVTGAESIEDVLLLVENIHCGSNHMYRIYLTGSSRFPIDTEVVKNSIEGFDVSVIDETKPFVDFAKLSEEFTLKGLFTKFALEEKDSLDAESFARAFGAGFSLIEKEERNENR